MKNRLSILISGGLLGLFGVLGAALVGFSHDSTAERIIENERQALLSKLGALIPADQTDNDMATDVIDVSSPRKLGTETTHVYRAKLGGEIFAVVLSPVVTQGYSGSMHLVIGVRRDGTLAGVRVLSHRETPGLGDKVELERSDWILGFDGRSLVSPPASRWAVRRDGGDFDQFTGATITPRAVVQGVRSALEFVRTNHIQLFGQTVAETEQGNE